MVGRGAAGRIGKLKPRRGKLIDSVCDPRDGITGGGGAAPPSDCLPLGRSVFVSSYVTDQGIWCSLLLASVLSCVNLLFISSVNCYFVFCYFFLVLFNIQTRVIVDTGFCSCSDFSLLVLPFVVLSRALLTCLHCLFSVASPVVLFPFLCLPFLNLFSSYSCHSSLPPFYLFSVSPFSSHFFSLSFSSSLKYFVLLLRFLLCNE